MTQKEIDFLKNLSYGQSLQILSTANPNVCLTEDDYWLLKSVIEDYILEDIDEYNSFIDSFLDAIQILTTIRSQEVNGLKAMKRDICISKVIEDEDNMDQEIDEDDFFKDL
jgi:hypothetical protein